VPWQEATVSFTHFDSFDSPEVACDESLLKKLYMRAAALVYRAGTPGGRDIIIIPVRFPPTASTSSGSAAVVSASYGAIVIQVKNGLRKTKLTGSRELLARCAADPVHESVLDKHLIAVLFSFAGQNKKKPSVKLYTYAHSLAASTRSSSRALSRSHSDDTLRVLL